MEDMKFIVDEDGNKCYLECSECGCDMLFKHDFGYIASSDSVPGFPICRTCLIEHCMQTNCMNCPYGNAETCSFLSTKEFYLEEKKREEEEERLAIDMHLYRYYNGKMIYECVKVLEREHGYVPLHFSEFYEYKKDKVGIAYFEGETVFYFNFDNDVNAVRQAIYDCYVNRVSELKSLIAVAEKNQSDAIFALSDVVASKHYLPSTKTYNARGIRTYDLNGKCTDTVDTPVTMNVDALFPGEMLTKFIVDGRFKGRCGWIHTVFVDGYATNIALFGLVPYSDKHYVRFDYFQWDDFCKEHCVEVFWQEK